jgi:geranylgeranyl pyrophosphate synthase
MIIKEPEIAMINAASSALDYLARKPRANDEETIRHIILSVNAKDEAKLGAIAAADKALKMNRINPESSDKQIVQEITNHVFHILADIRASSL